MKEYWWYLDALPSHAWNRWRYHYPQAAFPYEDLLAVNRSRVWLGIVGLLFIVIGVVLIRHLHLTLAAIGLVIGITWIVQGVAALIGGISGGAREGRAWWIIFGW